MLFEQIATRPTAEINGIIGGYTGEGAKTVIPAQAMAKVSFRLVGKQNPEKIRKAFRAFVKARLPADCKVEFGSFAGAPAIELPFDSMALAKTRAALSDRVGPRRRSRSGRAARSRSSATSSACSAWTRSWSASRSTTTACIRRTRSSISPASTRARARGRVSWRRWRDSRTSARPFAWSVGVGMHRPRRSQCVGWPGHIAKILSSSGPILTARVGHYGGMLRFRIPCVVCCEKRVRTRERDHHEMRRPCSQRLRAHVCECNCCLEKSAAAGCRTCLQVR